MKKLLIYQVGEFDIFRGKNDPKTWYVYNREEGRYVGGSFDTKAAAEEYAEGRK